MRRIVVLACLLFSFVAVGVSSAGAAPRSWASPQIQAVVDAGLMAPSAAEFRPDDPLTAGELSIVLATLGVPVVSVTDLDRPVSMRELDAQLVTAIGFREYARNLRLSALSAGLTPKQWLGTETVARLLGLRVNHVKTQEQLELQLGQPATRAEAAYSIARVLSISEFDLEAAPSPVGDVHVPGARPVAAGNSRPRPPFRRLAVRLGGNVGAAPAASRPEATGRLRLQRVRVARLQAAAVRGH